MQCFWKSFNSYLHNVSTSEHNSNWFSKLQFSATIFVFLPFLEIGHVTPLLTTHWMDPDMYHHTYVNEFTSACWIATTLGRCTWPHDLACHISWSSPPPSPTTSTTAPVPSQIFCSEFTIFMFYIWKWNFFLGCATPCVNIWGSPESGLYAPPHWGAECCLTCRKIPELTGCVYLDCIYTTIQELELLEEIQAVVCCKRVQISG